MLVPVSGFGKGDPDWESDGPGGRQWQMATWQMANVVSKQKRQKRQAHSKSFAGSDGAFVIR